MIFSALSNRSTWAVRWCWGGFRNRCNEKIPSRNSAVRYTVGVVVVADDDEFWHGLFVAAALVAVFILFTFICRCCTLFTLLWVHRSPLDRRHRVEGQGISVRDTSLFSHHIYSHLLCFNLSLNCKIFCKFVHESFTSQNGAGTHVSVFMEMIGSIFPEQPKAL